MHPDWKGRIKLSLFTVIQSYIWKSQKLHTKLLELINPAKLQNTKLTHTNQLFILTEQSKREVKKTIPFVVTSQKVKYLEINKLR